MSHAWCLFIIYSVVFDEGVVGLLPVDVPLEFGGRFWLERCAINLHLISDMITRKSTRDYRPVVRQIWK